MRRLVATIAVAVLAFTACSDVADRGENERRATDLPAAADAEADADIEAISAHLAALSDIATSNGGNRAAGTPGYDASLDYVSARMTGAGYEVSEQAVPYTHFEVTSPAILRVGGETFSEPEDLRTFAYSPGDSLTGPLVPVSFRVETRSHAGPGCDPSAFGEQAEGAIVLLRDGPCLFREQAANAYQAGALALVIAPADFTEGRLLTPTLLSPEGIEIPVLAAGDGAARKLFELSGRDVTLTTETLVEQRTTHNLIAESPSGDPERVVMVGGHLDSVAQGPGINDNGSGVATMIEVAETVLQSKPRNKVRFAFWAAEELGLLGSTHYVEELDESARNDIAMYLNLDMLGSSNAVRYVYGDSGAPEGSKDITRLFRSYFRAEGLPQVKIDLAGRSDHGPFLDAGIPVGGLFSGANMIKTPAEVKKFGGVPGEWEDPCYHQSCDTLDNVDLQMLDSMADAVAAAVMTYAGAGPLPAD